MNTGSYRYTETYVKRKSSPATQLGKVALIGVSAVLLVFGLLTQQGGLTFLGLAAAIGTYFLLPMFDIAWEYVYCDGQIDFDRISGGEKRKNMLKIDMDNVDILAPEKSHELDSYNHRPGIVVKDFSSKDPQAKRYCIFVADKGQNMKIIFEPSDEMVSWAKEKAHRRVFTD